VAPILMAEFILPWAAIWLSNIFLFHIPEWSLWLLFGGRPALSLLVMLTYWALRTWSSRGRHPAQHPVRDRGRGPIPCPAGGFLKTTSSVSMAIVAIINYL
jgi:hypothetical protein